VLARSRVPQQDSDDFVADALWACLLSFRAEGMRADERFELIRSVAARLLAGAPPPARRSRESEHGSIPHRKALGRSPALADGIREKSGAGRWNP
jgi:hypothetical protein